MDKSEILRVSKEVPQKLARLSTKIVMDNISPVEVINEIMDTFTDAEKAICTERFIVQSLKKLANTMPDPKDPAFS